MRFNLTAKAQNSNDLIKGACSIKLRDAEAQDALDIARLARAQWHADVFVSLRSKSVTALKLGADFEAAKESGDLPEDLTAITNKDLSYVKVIGELLLLPSGDDAETMLPAGANIGRMWLLVKQGVQVKGAEKIIRAKGQTIGGAYTAIKAAADKANEDLRTSKQTPEGLLKAAFATYSKALKLIADGAEITDEVKVLLGAYVAGAQSVAVIDNKREAAKMQAAEAEATTTATVLTGQIAA